MSDEMRQQLETWRTASESGSFETAVTTLDEVVSFLEEGHHGLDDTVHAYEIGVALARRCEDLIAAADLRISQIRVDADQTRASFPDPEDLDDEEIEDPDDFPF